MNSNYTVQMLKEDILHYPTLRTILQVENILMNAEKAMSKEALKRALGGRIMHPTLNLILQYLEDSGKIYMGEKGIVWIYTPSKKLENAVRRGVEH